MDKEYIEREAATTLFARACGECKEACEEFDGFYSDCNQCLLHGVLKEFAAIPDADVRPVVFCKNCMHSVQGKKSLKCKKHRYVWNNMNRWVNDEDFCCWGAEREES